MMTVRLQKRVEAGVSRTLWEGYRKLILKRREKGLTAREQQRVEALAEKLESFNVEWLRWAKELADLRRMTVDRLLAILDIQRPADV